MAWKVTILTIRQVFRKVEAVRTSEGEGAIVKRVFPTGQLMHFDPFALLDEFNIEPPARALLGSVSIQFCHLIAK